MGKRKVEYPEWAEKYRSKGHTIRKVRNGYGLYRCTSVSDPDLPYPKSKQTYLGMITEKDGFIPKKTDGELRYIEYGLSHVLWLNFRRDTMRSIYGGDTNAARLAVVRFIFGSEDPLYLEFSYLTYGQAEELTALAEKTAGSKSIANGVRTLEKCLKEKLPDEKEYRLVTKLLMLCVVEAGPCSERKPAIPESVRDVLDRQGLKYE